MLCDDPTARVDVENQASITALLREINEQKKISIIFTTHDRRQAADLAHETLVLEQGRLVDSHYENVFFGTVEPADTGMVRCELPGGVVLHLPGHVSGSIGKQRIFLDPSRIRIHEGAWKKNATRPLQGSVVQLNAQGKHVRMLVDIGVLLTVFLPRSEYLEQTPVIGSRVELEILPGALQ
jgi:tungstate transport system ATP-binding protein